jgi:hypothetical protein
LDQAFVRVYVSMVAQFVLLLASLYVTQPSLGLAFLRVPLELTANAIAVYTFLATRSIDVNAIKRMGEADLGLTSVLSLVNAAMPGASELANTIATLAVITLAFSVGFLYALGKVFT